MPASIPANHNGMYYSDFLSELSRKRSVKRYLEIGVQRGRLLSKIHAKHAVGVDPSFAIDTNITANKQTCTLVQAGSDEFFREYDCVGLIGGRPDLAFLDGMHTFEFLLRDFYHTESISSTSTLIGIHDCLPLNAEMALRNESSALLATAGGAFEGWWTGDVWKITPILRRYRPDLRIIFVDCAPTGIVFITNLNPSSSVLKDKYHEIVREYSSMPNDLRSIEELFSGTEIVHSCDIMKDSDYSLYFST